jgi:NADP-dependent 3-hydroxy acid dehydrogenase YdfG
MAQFSGGKAVDLKGKAAIVTGGGTGIGEAITRRFVACGARVCIAGRRQELLGGAAKSLPDGLVKTCSADVTGAVISSIVRSVKKRAGGANE